jgi:hypothetical protein
MIPFLIGCSTARVPPLRDLGAALGARALGHWQRHDDGLRIDLFLRAADLPELVARRFVDGTRLVPLDRVELSIARAAATGDVVEALAADLPADFGSGYWLREFVAGRSVAVPLPGGVVSIALPHGCPRDAAEVAALLRAALGIPPG